MFDECEIHVHNVVCIILYTTIPYQFHCEKLKNISFNQK